MPKSSRRQSRILAFQTIYQRQKIGVQERSEQILTTDNSLAGDHLAFYRSLVDQTWQELSRIDSQIKKHLINWKQERISESLNALLRIATCELMYFPGTDGKIVLNEAIEICRLYVDTQATKFLNGVLHAIWKDQASDSTLA